MTFLNRRFLTVLVVFVLILAALAFLILPIQGQDLAVPTEIPILMYHHIVEPGNPCNAVTVTSDKFETDLKWLQENGYKTILPSDLIKHKRLPAKIVLLTFDDGYSSNYEFMFPLLKKYKMKAAVSLIVSLSETADAGHLTWDMCREMKKSGLVEFGSHTYALHNPELHGNFNPDGVNGIQRKIGERPDAFERRVFTDLDKSKNRMQEELGVSPSFFAYPYGAVEPCAETYIQQNFSMSFTTVPEIADVSQSLYQLPRFTVTMDTELKDILPIDTSET